MYNYIHNDMYLNYYFHLPVKRLTVHFIHIQEEWRVAGRRPWLANLSFDFFPLPVSHNTDSSQWYSLKLLLIFSLDETISTEYFSRAIIDDPSISSWKRTRPTNLEKWPIVSNIENFTITCIYSLCAFWKCFPGKCWGLGNYSVYLLTN